MNFFGIAVSCSKVGPSFDNEENNLQKRRAKSGPELLEYLKPMFEQGYKYLTRQQNVCF